MGDALVAVARAVDFAARMHIDQRRKGARAEPYINHPAEVAALLAEATDGADVTLILGGLLHDVVEDTPVTRAGIEAEFGAEVAALVAEVTDDRSLPSAERKRLQVEHAPHKSTRARMIKLADKTSNLRALAMSPPPDWDAARRREYLDWAHAVAAGCRGVNARLETWFDEAHAAGIKALDGGG